MWNVLLLGDLLAVTLAVTAVSAIRPEFVALLPWVLLTLPLWAWILQPRAVEADAASPVGRRLLQDLPQVLRAVGIGTLAVAAAVEAVTPGRIQPSVLLMLAGFAGSGLIVVRSALRRSVPALVEPPRVIVIGCGHAIDLFARALRAHRRDMLVEQLPPLAALTVADLASSLGRHRVARVVVPEWQVDREMLLHVLQVACERRVHVSLLPRSFEAIGAVGAVGRLEGRMLLRREAATFPLPARVLKRAVDVVGAALLLIATAPLLATIVIAVKLDSPGPVLFRQRRIGKGGKVFSVLKFRTMIVGAESLAERLMRGSADPHWLLLEDDPRVTRLGRFLRHSSLDELPQLWNVLKGDMSLVGPRPLIEREDALVPDWGRSRADVPPGLTGLWQVLGRTSLSFEQMLGLDCLYVRSWSVWRDVQLLTRTLPAVLTRRGAN